MDLSGFMNQEGTWERKLSMSEGWNQVSYSDPITIRYRKSSKVKFVKSAQEVSSVDVTKILTEADIAIGDKIDGEEILAVDQIRDVDGQRNGCNAYPRPPTGYAP